MGSAPSIQGCLVKECSPSLKATPESGREGRLRPAAPAGILGPALVLEHWSTVAWHWSRPGGKTPSSWGQAALKGHICLWVWVPTLHRQSPIHPVHSPGGSWHPPGMGHFTAAPARGALTRGPFTHTAVTWVLPGDPGRRQGEIAGLQAPAMSQALASSLGRHRGSLLNTHLSIQESTQTVLSEPLHAVHSHGRPGS